MDMIYYKTLQKQSFGMVHLELLLETEPEELKINMFIFKMMSTISDHLMNYLLIYGELMMG